MGTIRETQKCRGSVMIMVTIGMIALFGLAALGLDTGLVFWDKARLQNAVDAAALSGAKVLDDVPGDTATATNAAIATFNLNAAGVGNEALADAVDDGLTPTVQFSATLNPFTPGSAVGPYVRVIADDLPRGGIFARIFGIDTFNVDATAVAGPSPTLGQVCDVVPAMVCGDPTQPNYLPYPAGTSVELKYASGTDAEDTTPGNFHLVRLDDSTGGSDIRDAFAGLYEKCTNDDGTIDTEPGNTVGPVSQGVDTRFEPCGPPSMTAAKCAQYDVRPDTVTAVDIDYAEYKVRQSRQEYNYPTGKPYRRIVKVPVADCSAMGPGATTGIPIYTIACFFLERPVPSGGANATVDGEFIGDGDGVVDGCNAKGVPGPNPSSSTGPYKIQLYKDPDGRDS